MGIGLRQGRVFTDADARDADVGVVVASESLVRKYLPHENPIGKRITRDPSGKGRFATIVGVVNDVRNLNLGDEPEPEMYFDYRQFFFAPFALPVSAPKPLPYRTVATVVAVAGRVTAGGREQCECVFIFPPGYPNMRVI